MVIEYRYFFEFFWGFKEFRIKLRVGIFFLGRLGLSILVYDMVILYLVMYFRWCSYILFFMFFCLNGYLDFFKFFFRKELNILLFCSVVSVGWVDNYRKICVFRIILRIFWENRTNGWNEWLFVYLYYICYN